MNQKGFIPLNLITKSDLLRRKANFTFKGKNSVSTAFGGFLSLLLSIIIFYKIISELSSITNYEDPQIYQINELEEDPAAVPLNAQNNFLMAFVVTVDSKPANLSTDSPFNFHTHLKKTIRAEDRTKTSIKYPVLWRPCLKSDFPKEIYGENVYSTYTLDYGFCLAGINYTDSITGSCPIDVLDSYPDCISPPNFNIKGTYLAREFEFLQFKLSLCDPSDPSLPSNIQCDTENITQKFQTLEFKFSLYYANTLVTPTYYAHPNRTLLDTTYWVLNPKISKVADINVDRLTIKDVDDHFSSVKAHNRSFYTIQADKIRELEILMTSAAESEALLEWNLRRSSLNVVLTRIYPKVLDFLISLGGFSKALIFVIGILAIKHAQHRCNITLANELFDFRMSGPNRRVRSVMPLLTVGTSETRSSIRVESIQTPDSVRGFFGHKRVFDFFESRNKERGKLNSSTGEYFRYSFRCFKCLRRRYRENNLMGKALRLVMEDLDITKIIARLNEVEKLKMILLNPDQREAFEAIMEKPLVTLFKRGLSQQGSIIVNKGPVRSRTSTSNKSFDRARKSRFFKTNFNNLPQYERLYIACQYLENDKDSSNKVYNKKLLAMVDQRIIYMFKKVEHLSSIEEYDKFEEIIRTIADKP